VEEFTLLMVQGRPNGVTFHEFFFFFFFFFFLLLLLLLLGPVSVKAPVCTAAFEAYCAALNIKFSPDSTALCLL
jgi:hypothetical protein